MRDPKGQGLGPTYLHTALAFVGRLVEGVGEKQEETEEEGKARGAHP